MTSAAECRHQITWKEGPKETCTRTYQSYPPRCRIEIFKQEIKWIITNKYSYINTTYHRIDRVDSTRPSPRARWQTQKERCYRTPSTTTTIRPASRHGRRHQAPPHHRRHPRRLQGSRARRASTSGVCARRTASWHPTSPPTVPRGSGTRTGCSA
jgi:hypothetical protein